MGKQIMKKCPKCGSKRVAPILYGLPVFSDELEQKLNNEELYLGGCCVSHWDPAFHCFECGKDVGTPPILLSKRGEEDYRDIVTAVRFCDGGYFGGHDEVYIRKTATEIIMDCSPSFRREALPFSREITEKEWRNLLDRLFCKLYVHEWKKTYDDPCVLDGEQWDLEFHLTGRRVRNYGGSNAFPAYWAELKRTFTPFLKECPPAVAET